MRWPWQSDSAAETMSDRTDSEVEVNRDVVAGMKAALGIADDDPDRMFSTDIFQPTTHSYGTDSGRLADRIRDYGRG